MDKLWAPWRIKYVTKIGKNARGCIFCNILKEKKDKKNFLITRTKHAYSVLNIYPYNNGHMLIVPNRHVSDLSGLRKEEREDLMDLLEATKKLLDKPGTNAIMGIYHALLCRFGLVPEKSSRKDR